MLPLVARCQWGKVPGPATASVPDLQPWQIRGSHRALLQRLCQCRALSPLVPGLRWLCPKCAPSSPAFQLGDRLEGAQATGCNLVPPLPLFMLPLVCISPHTRSEAGRPPPGQFFFSR